MNHEPKRKPKPAARMTTALLAAVLILLATAACVNRVTTIKPDCDVPPMPALPIIPSADLTVDDYTFWLLMDRERLLADWALEMQATLEVICK